MILAPDLTIDETASALLDGGTDRFAVLYDAAWLQRPAVAGDRDDAADLAQEAQIAARELAAQTLSSRASPSTPPSPCAARKRP